MITELILFIIGLVLIALLLGFHSMEERFDRIIELLEEITKPRYENKSGGLDVSFADGTNCEVKE